MRCQSRTCWIAQQQHKENVDEGHWHRIVRLHLLRDVAGEYALASITGLIAFWLLS